MACSGKDTGCGCESCMGWHEGGVQTCEADNHEGNGSPSRAGRFRQVGRNFWVGAVGAWNARTGAPGLGLVGSTSITGLRASVSTTRDLLEWGDASFLQPGGPSRLAGPSGTGSGSSMARRPGGPTVAGGQPKDPCCTCRGPTTGGPSGPSTPGPSGTGTPGPTGPYTGGPGPTGGRPTAPYTPGPAGPSGGGPRGTLTPGPAGPSTGGPRTPITHGPVTGGRTLLYSCDNGRCDPCGYEQGGIRTMLTSGCQMMTLQECSQVCNNRMRRASSGGTAGLTSSKEKCEAILGCHWDDAECPYNDECDEGGWSVTGGPIWAESDTKSFYSSWGASTDFGRHGLMKAFNDGLRALEKQCLDRLKALIKTLPHPPLECKKTCPGHWWGRNPCVPDVVFDSNPKVSGVQIQDIEIDSSGGVRVRIFGRPAFWWTFPYSTYKVRCGGQLRWTLQCVCP